MSLRKSTNVQHISYPSFINICKSIKGYETELVYVIDCFQCWYTAPVQSSGNLITFCVRWKCSNQTLKFVISQSVHLSLCLIHKQHGCEISYTKRCLHKAVCPVCKWACVCVCLFTWCAVVTFPLCSNSPDVRAALFFLSCCRLTDALPLLCPPVNSLARSKYCWRPIRRRKRTRQRPTGMLLWAKARTRPLRPIAPLPLDPHSPSASLTLAHLPAKGRRRMDARAGEGRRRRMGGRGQGWGCVSCCRQGGWVSDHWGST